MSFMVKSNQLKNCIFFFLPTDLTEKKIQLQNRQKIKNLFSFKTFEKKIVYFLKQKQIKV